MSSQICMALLQTLLLLQMLASASAADTDSNAALLQMPADADADVATSTAFAYTISPSTNGTLLAGQDLMQAERLYSPDGSAFLVPQTDGNLVVYNAYAVAKLGHTAPEAALWQSGTYLNGGPQPFVLAMQQDCNLVLYNGNGGPRNAGNAVFATGTYNQGVPPCSLVVSDAGGGGFVVVDSTGRALFSTLRVLALPSQTAYVYNAVSGSWAAAGSLPASEPNYEFAQTRLHSGSVLLAGGLGAPSAHAYLFSPASLAFSPTGSMAVPRASHQLVTSFGGSALAVGGTTGPSPTSAPGGQLTGSIEAFSPSSGTWRQAGALVLPRAGHASVVLPNGQVLTTGGFADDGPRRATKRAELFDPVLGTSRETGSMGSPRAGHSMLLLADGTALACGGINTMPVLDDGGQFSGTEYLISCDLYTPSKGSWEQTGNMTKRLLEAAGQPFVPWVGFTLSLLPNGQVLASGPPLNFNASLCVQQFNLFDAHARTWSEPAPPVPSFFGPQNLLPTGELLLANAFSSVSECQNSFRLPPSTTLYNPITGNLQVTGSLPVFRTQPYLLSTAVLF